MLGEERRHAQNQCRTGLAMESPVKSQATVHASTVGFIESYLLNTI
jgi:hypothetical protein